MTTTFASAGSEVLAPGQNGYRESADTVFAAGTPDIVVRPRDAAEIAGALRHATDAGLLVSVRSGGHSLAGFGTHSSGMVIDLRHLNVTRILDRGTRRVRIGAGATWGSVARTLGQAGLALTSGDTASVGVGGLTLGGGIGWLVRKHGLAIDSLTGADLVTADGQVIRTDPDRQAGLFWALRGGGGNFGIVASFDYTAQPVDAVHYGTIVYRLDGSQDGMTTRLPSLIASWRDLVRTSDENLTTALAMAPGTAGRPATVMLRCCYAGPDQHAATAALSPFRRLAPVATDDVHVVPYPSVLDEMSMPTGVRVETRNTFFRRLDDEPATGIAELVRDGAAIELRGLGGAFSRVPADLTAFAHRDAEVLLVAAAMLAPGTPPERASQALAAWPAVAAHGTGAYVGFLGTASAEDVAAAYPPATYQRLAAIKRHYDPNNVFRRNHNILGGPGTM
jgi:FAD/FMN-containing dehydrogenase